MGRFTRGMVGGVIGGATAAVTAIGVNEALHSPRLGEKHPDPENLSQVIKVGAIAGMIAAEVSPRTLHLATVASLATTAVIKLNRVNQPAETTH